ncbi:MAG: S8 family serine peptidase, partial [Saprospiraceae bacterium]|nr:S8 family serine peptidase [Saprospiraceae bacterium]
SRSEVLDQQMGWGIIDAQLLVENTKIHKNKGHMKSDTTSKKNNNNSGSNDHTNTNSASNNNSTSPSNNTPSRYALHVALDNVNQQVYNNVYADLDGCINDSKLYQSLTAGFTSQTILNDDDATRENFKSELKKLAKNAKSGDFVFISYAGHGGTIQDHNNDEEDGGNDETLILYDGIWIDDETKELIYSFKDGVNILFVSDSCHSGTNTRGKRGLSIDIPDNHSESARKYRGIKSGYIRKVYQENKDFYDREWAKLKNIGRGKKNDSPKASVVSIAACQDDQLANEINKNGVFTLAFMEAVQNNPSIALEDILEEVRDGIETQYIYDQNPVFSNYGNNNDALKKMSFSDLFTGARVEQSGPISDIDEAEPKNKYELVSTGYLLTETDALPITDSTSNKARGINDDISSAWDAAYSAYFQSDKSEFIEPDIIAVDHINKELENKRGNKNPDKYLHTYPAPELTDPDRFSWHKGDLFSQLDQAFRNACPESNANNPADKSSYPIIAHIDTGILSNHPSLPLHYDDTLSNNFTNAEDKDKWFAFAEQQGHGHATVSILAGQSFETQLPDGDTMPRYFGAFPYAQVISLKISESVFITRAKNFAKAVEYAISQNVDVITMSMAGAPSKRMLNAINKAYEKGITIVSAGGNSWTKFPKVLLPKSIMYPARFNRVIAAVGTTYLDTPYLVKTPPKRAEGSPHMQSCYGPAIAMETAIAAYTPNITWLSHKDAPYYSRSGGGTSSATPQIAAAVALFLHKNRDFISKHITQPQDQWKKIELARKALFETAKKDTGYDSYYGKGILQANEMMNFDVNLNVLNSLEKHDPDSLGRTGIDDLFKMWKRRSKSGKDSQKYNDPILEEMLALEIEQLIVSQEEFQEFSLNDGISVDLANAILKSPRSSKFLKSMMARKGNKSLRAQQSNQSFVRPIYDVDLDDSSRVTYWSNSPYNVTKREVPKANKEEIIESFEIDLEDNQKNLNRGFRSSLSSIEIGFSYDKNNVNPIHLVEVELYDGTKRYKWVYANEIKDKKKRGNESLEAFVPYGESYVSLSTVSNNSTRGLGSWLKKLGQKIKKIIVNVVRIIKDEPKSGLKGLIYRQITGRGKWSQYDGGTPKINTTKKTLLLIHGTWSHTEASFDELLKNNAFKNKLISEGYNSSILGYDMSTLKDSVTENAAEIKTKLASLKLDNNKLTVIAFSRGCLVAKEVFKDPANTPKMVFAGGTINGTPLAYKDNIPKVLDKITNLSVLATGGVVSGIFKLVSFLTKKLLDLPGLKDQAPNSALIINQRGFVYDAKKHIFIGANFEPTGLIKKTLDTRYDVELFADQPNDGVTPVSSSLNLKPGEDGSELPNLLITSGNINHFNLFDDNDAIQRVINHV